MDDSQNHFEYKRQEIIEFDIELHNHWTKNETKVGNKDEK